MKRGRLIVIDGTDGSGKATQTKLLVRRLRGEGHVVRTIDFPQYEKNFFGKLIGECLTGQHGEFLSVDPHIASVLYAADRFESAERVRSWLDEGAIVIADRYVSSNQIHQGAKISNARERRAFLSWLDKMEYEVFGIPRPDLIVYLDVPVAISRELLGAKSLARKKKYSKDRADQAEADHAHQEASRRSALRMVEASNRWVRIDCAPEGELLPRSAIHELVYGAIEDLL